MGEPGDRELLEGCIEGDFKMREEFVLRFSNLVYAAVQSVCKFYHVSFDQQDLEDWHNSIFLSLFDKDCRKLQKYQGTNGCSLASWVRVVTINYMKDNFRRTKDAFNRPDRIYPIDEFFSQQSDEPSALDRLESEEIRALIKEEIKKLPARQRLILELSVLRELPIEEVSRILKISVNNGYTIKHRAIQQLKRNILRKKD